MVPTRRAVIDVGTNSVKLLVADVLGHAVRPVHEESIQTRLGHGFYQTRRLQPQSIAATAKVTAGFAATARQYRAASTRVLATSAAREALNASELTAAIQAAAELQVEVISGDQEAYLGFQGVLTDPRLAQTHLLLLDVGGGSAQCILGHRQHIAFQRSFPIGTVRLMETLPCSDPPKTEELHACQHWLDEFLQRRLPPELSQAIHQNSPTAAARSLLHPDSPAPPAGLPTPGVQLVCVGGTASILGCMEEHLETFDRDRLESTRLSAGRVAWHLARLWNLPLAERQNIIGLPSNRADVILFGVAIYRAVMARLGFLELRISTRGLRFAALVDTPPLSGQLGPT
jgi:exopolyphosphatase/guanosine-5'-triphosphate,3'-diphosphate pyrophosphatase